MEIATATWLVRAFYAYLAVGVLFAVWFVAYGCARLDARAAAGTRGFRLLIVPGTIALWPILAVANLRRRSGR